MSRFWRLLPLAGEAGDQLAPAGTGLGQHLGPARGHQTARGGPGATHPGATPALAAPGVANGELNTAAGGAICGPKGQLCPLLFHARMNKLRLMQF